MMKETDGDTSKWENIPCSRIRKVIVIPVKVQWKFSQKWKKKDLLFVWGHIRSWIAKNFWKKKKKKKAVDFTLLFLPNYKTLVIRTVWYWYQNRHIDQGSKTESVEINSCIHG